MKTKIGCVLLRYFVSTCKPQRCKFCVDLKSAITNFVWLKTLPQILTQVSKTKQVLFNHSKCKHHCDQTTRKRGKVRSSFKPNYVTTFICIVYWSRFNCSITARRRLHEIGNKNNNNNGRVTDVRECGTYFNYAMAVTGCYVGYDGWWDDDQDEHAMVFTDTDAILIYFQFRWFVSGIWCCFLCQKCMDLSISITQSRGFWMEVVAHRVRFLTSLAVNL